MSRAAWLRVAHVIACVLRREVSAVIVRFPDGTVTVTPDSLPPLADGGPEA